MHNLFGQRHLTTETCCKVWTQETHCSCTRHVLRHVPRPCPCTTGVMKSRTDPLSAVTHAAEAATQETGYSCTRHVPRRVPRPCPCKTGVMKSTTDHLSTVAHAAEAATQETHCSCTRGGQTFPKSTEIRNSVAFRAVFSVFFRPNFSVWQNRFPSSFCSSHDVLTYWEANSG